MSSKYRSIQRGHIVEAMRFAKPYWRVREFCPVLSMQGRGMTGRRIDHALLPAEDDVRVELGDYIVKGAGGFFTAYAPAVFKQIYEVA